MLGLGLSPLARKVTEAGGGGRIPVAIPAGLGWNSASYPLAIYQSGSRYTLDASTTWLRSFVSADIWAATPYYVDATKADNTGDGLSPATAKRDIHAAITAANADAQAGACIYVKAGTYGLTNGITSSTTAVRATKPCALIATDGRVTHHSALDLTWSVHSGTTYKASRNQIGFVLDLSNGSAELTNVADVATCVATPGSWVEATSVVYVNRADGAAVTNANTRVLLWVNAATFDHTSKDLYVEGFDFQGGRYAALDCGSLTTITTRDVVAVNCTFQYAGQPANPAPGFTVDRVDGLALLKDCGATKNSTDGINFHANGAAVLYALTINCSASDNGRYSATSCNGHTGHESVIGIDVNGVYATSRGATTHWVQTSKLWCLGMEAACTSAGADAAFKASNSAVMWLQGTAATASNSGAYALHAQGTAGVIHKRDHTTVTGIEQVDAGATIDTF